MPENVHCKMHGETAKTYVCTHLVGEATGLGFNRDKPTEDDPYPDAWCDDCELILAAHGGWNEESEKLVSIALLCSGCYERARIRNQRPTTTLSDLAHLRWKCSSCDEWHEGPCLDFGYSEPYYWRGEFAASANPGTLLTDDYCAIRGEHFFVRGLLQLPIVGTGESFCWGVWGSLSQENFEKLRAMPEDEAAQLSPMLSWLSTKLPDYPDTLNLRMYVHPQLNNQRPCFRLEEADHPLAREYHHGISPERVKALMRQLLPAVDFGE